MWPAFHSVVSLSSTEDDNTEDGENDYDADYDGGEDQEMTVVQADTVKHLDQVPSQVGGGRSKGRLQTVLAKVGGDFREGEWRRF